MSYYLCDRFDSIRFDLIRFIPSPLIFGSENVLYYSAHLGLSMLLLIVGVAATYKNRTIKTHSYSYSYSYFTFSAGTTTTTTTTTKATTMINSKSRSRFSAAAVAKINYALWCDVMWCDVHAHPHSTNQQSERQQWRDRCSAVRYCVACTKKNITFCNNNDAHCDEWINRGAILFGLETFHSIPFHGLDAELPLPPPSSNP